MGIIWMVLLGLVAGLIAKALMPGRDPGGWIVTAVLGIAGSVVGGWLFGVIGVGGGGPAGLIGSVIGALILLWVYRVVKK
ncbi:MAG: GlsB/YeaQ/YmgE family stress response membrane protein [Gemmatimonadota bacterium]|jgi:uncharacterized membrane protein YeaQ/YmgE (transglycosylase-associated protein family)